MGRLTLASIAASTLLAGCATTPGACDPNQADFFSGISCSAGGGYAARTSALQNDLAGARYRLYNEQSGASAAAVDAGAAQREQRQASAALAGISRQNGVLRARLNAAARRQNADQATIAQQRGQLDQLERDRQAAQRNGASDAQLAEIRRRQQALLDALSE